ncbi:MAG: lactate dehydrogenase, partial [Comamonas sp.]|nr:lactate dehydrogenase [Comamonas sp.]
HYTSVPNILKVLNPLLLDELRAQLEAAGGSRQKLLNLRKRIARIRVLDPACGSGNFLVIAYKQLRAIEAEVNQRRGEAGRASDIPLTNFRGIELRSFPAEIARLALIIAEYQCDVLHRGQKEALEVFLPLDAQNWIVCGNALRLDWLSVCPPTGTGVRVTAHDLFETPLDQAEIDFENEGGETFICGNPPYLGSTWQDAGQKADLQAIFDGRVKSWKSLDYVAGWFMKAADFCARNEAVAAFVSTNSICQGQQVPILWPAIFSTGCQIQFAHTSFKWANLASHNAGVTVAIVGITAQPRLPRRLYLLAGRDDEVGVKEVEHINAYLVSGPNIIVEKINQPLDDRGIMDAGGKPVDGGNLFLNAEEKSALLMRQPTAGKFIKKAYGASEYIRGDVRYCLWIEDGDVQGARSIPEIAARLQKVAEARSNSPKLATRKGSAWPQRFEEVKQTGREVITIVPKVSSESRDFLPVGLLPLGSIITDLAFALYDAPLWNMALIASRLHLVWIATVCGKLKTDFRYSNTLGWNTFPVPLLTEQMQADLTECAENILLAREAHFPATIADLYDPEAMPDNLRAAHERNDEVIERIYIGRRFRNDTERLEKLFELYTQMAARQPATPARKTTTRRTTR